MTWPSGVPLVGLLARPSIVETHEAVPGSRGPSIRAKVPFDSLARDGWQAQADDLEDPDDRDSSRFLLVAVLTESWEQPRWLPSSLEPRLADPSPACSPFPRSRPLRC